MKRLKVLFNKIFRRKQLKALDDELKMHIDVENGQATVSANHPALAVLAGFLTEYYEETSRNGGFPYGANYVGVDVVDYANLKGYRITIHRWGRPEPATVAANFRKALNAIVCNPADALDIAFKALEKHNYEVSKGGETDVERENSNEPG